MVKTRAYEEYEEEEANKEREEEECANPVAELSSEDEVSSKDIAMAGLVRANILQTLEQWVCNFPDRDKPLVGAAGSGRTLTANDILEEVRSRTSFGESLVQQWFTNALDHIARTQGASILGRTSERNR